jgi:uncharacterized protein (DUF983 family)
MRRERPAARGEKPARMIGRALRLHCPLCGRGKMFRSWVRLNDHCSSCSFRFDRNEPDYFIGAYTINLIVAELIVIGIMLLVIWSTWPEVPWDRMTWGLLAVMVPAPLVTYPFSKSLWLAIDLLFQPPKPDDYLTRPTTATTDG